MTTTIPLNKRGIPVSRLVLGCMGLGGGWDQSPVTSEHIKHAQDTIEAALSIGINFFDHADIYTMGKAEKVFGQVLRQQPSLRDSIFLQSKCGIRFQESSEIPGRYDFSEDHILRSVDGILERLGVEYLDFLLLHRPDPLMDPEEVANAIHTLKTSGKVRNFGVSNMGAGQIRLLQASCNEPFIVNQLEMSLAKIGWLDQGVHINQAPAAKDIFPEGTLEYCRMENIQIQAWSPLARGIFSGNSSEDQSDSVKETARRVQQMALDKGTTPESIILSWLMKHPAGIQPVIGTANSKRIEACRDAESIILTRDEWYSLYVSSRGISLP